MTHNLEITPDIKISVHQTFGIDSEMQVDGFSKKNEYVPDIDKNYKIEGDLRREVATNIKRYFNYGEHLGKCNFCPSESISGSLILNPLFKETSFPSARTISTSRT